MPHISILIPVYNVETYLRECLDSVCGQTLKNLEIICINDGSTDNSLKILRDYATKDRRISIINKKNTGYGDSMNQGIKRATGEYIGIVEPDDWIEKDAFEKLYTVAKQFSADIVKANYYKFTSKSSVKTSENTPENSNILISAKTHPEVFQFAPAVWSAIYRRKFLTQNEIIFLPTPGASYQDLGFSFKVWATAKNIVLIPDAFLHYRLDNSSSSVNNPNKVNCVVEEYVEIESYLVERGIFEDFGARMEAAKFRNYHWNFQRLPSPSAKNFYQTWRQEMLDADEDHLLHRTDFSTLNWLALRTMLRHPRLAYRVLRLRALLTR